MRRLAMMVVAMAWAGGCAGPEHLSQDFGLRTTQYFQAQSVRVLGSSSQPVTGLDPQEAGIVSGAYRRSLVPKGTTVTEEPILFVAPPSKASGGMPPASVPPGRR